LTRLVAEVIVFIGALTSDQQQAMEGDIWH